MCIRALTPRALSAFWVQQFLLLYAGQRIRAYSEENVEMVAVHLPGTSERSRRHSHGTNEEGTQPGTINHNRSVAKYVSACPKPEKKQERMYYVASTCLVFASIGDRPWRPVAPVAISQNHTAHAYWKSITVCSDCFLTCIGNIVRW